MCPRPFTKGLIPGLTRWLIITELVGSKREWLKQVKREGAKENREIKEKEREKKQYQHEEYHWNIIIHDINMNEIIKYYFIVFEPIMYTRTSRLSLTTKFREKEIKERKPKGRSNHLGYHWVLAYHWARYWNKRQRREVSRTYLELIYCDLDT